MNNEKLVNEYEELIERLEKSEKWVNDKMYTWEYVKANKPKIWSARIDIINKIEDNQRKRGLPYR